MKTFLTLKPKTKRILEIVASGLSSIIALIVSLALVIFLKDLDEHLSDSEGLRQFEKSLLIAISVLLIVVNVALVVLGLLIMFYQPHNTPEAFKPRYGLLIPSFVLSFLTAVLYFKVLWYLGLIMVIGAALFLVDLVSRFDIKKA